MDIGVPTGSSLRVVPANVHNPLFVFAGIPFGVQMIVRGHLFEEPIIFASHEVGVGIAHLTEIGCLNATEAAGLLSELEELKGQGMLETVDDIMEAIAAKAGPASRGVFRFALCSCGVEPTHGYLYSMSGSLACKDAIVGRDMLLVALSIWVAEGAVTAQNAANVLQQAKGLPLTPVGVKRTRPVVPIPTDVVEKLRGLGPA